MSGPNETKKHRRDAWRRLVKKAISPDPNAEPLATPAPKDSKKKP